MSKGFTLLALPTLASSEGGVRMVAEEGDSFPCRRCLRDTRAGEAVLLISYDPFFGDSPYRGAGPIFVHESACERFSEGDLPDQLRGRLLSVRAYDDGHMMVDADVVDGGELESSIEHTFDTTRASYLHVHYARPGCFAVRVERA
jgi:hypothetical protein